MIASVKRDYRSELRAAQALETRRSIVAAASKLFVEDGYGATTIDAVAEAAGVSRKTVFTAVGGKLDLLKLALDWAVAGDDRPVAVADRGEMRQIMAEDDAVVLLRGCARAIVAITGRAAGLAQALEVAAGMDPAACDLVEQARRHRLDDARMVVGRLRSLGALRGDLTYGEAVDLVWLATDPVLFDRLVRVRGWSRRRFEKWLAQYLIGQLIGI
jgi:AcrR family transcriptional regulator